MFDETRTDEPEIIGNDRDRDDVDVNDNDNPQGGEGALPAHLKGKSAEAISSYYEGRLASEREAREELMGEFSGGNRRGSRRDPDPEPEQEPEEEAQDLTFLDEIDIVDELSEKGVKGLLDIIEKAGYVKKGAVQKTIKGEFSQLEQAYSLQNEFPELADPNSRFAKTTQKHLSQINRDPDYKNLPPAKKYKLAAREAQVELGTSRGQQRSRQQQPAEEFESDEDYMLVGSNPEEDARQRRIQQQAGPRGRQQQRNAETSQELSPEQKSICRKLGISEKNYAARANKGVTVHRRR